MTGSSQTLFRAACLLLVLGLAGCAKGGSTLDDTANAGTGANTGTGGVVGGTGTGGAAGTQAVAPAATPCGNGMIDQGEDCDGMNLNGATCVSLGFTGGGALSCDPMTCRYQTSLCRMQEMSTGMGGSGN